MFDLDKAIESWRMTMNGEAGLAPEHLDELESHLRDELERLAPMDLTAEEALLVAGRRLGEAGEIASEFQKEHGPGREFTYAHLALELSILAGAVIGYMSWPMIIELPGIWAFQAKILGALLGAMLTRAYVGTRLGRLGLIAFEPARGRTRVVIIGLGTILLGLVGLAAGSWYNGAFERSWLTQLSQTWALLIGATGGGALGAWLASRCFIPLLYGEGVAPARDHSVAE